MSEALNLPLRSRRDVAIDIARYALHRILLGDPDPRLLAEKALGDIATLLGETDR